MPLIVAALKVPVNVSLVPLTAVPARVDALTVPVNVAPVPLMVVALNVPEKLPFVFVIPVSVMPVRMVPRPSMSAEEWVCPSNATSTPLTVIPLAEMLVKFS